MPKRDARSLSGKKGQRGPGGFSLVEVVLAIGIVSFCIFAIMAMLPVGLEANRDSRDETQAISIIQAMINDRRSSPQDAPSVLYNIPKISDNKPVTLFVRDDGTVSPTLTSNDPSNSTSVRYRIVVTPEKVPAPPADVGVDPAPAYLLFHASWPAAVTAPTAASVEIVAALRTQ